MMTLASSCSALATSTSCRSPGDRRSIGVSGGNVEIDLLQKRARARVERGPVDQAQAVLVGAAGKRSMKMFSAIERLPKRLSSWWMKATPAALACLGFCGA